MAYLQTCRCRGEIYSHVKIDFVHTFFNIVFLYTILIALPKRYLSKEIFLEI